MYVRHKKCTCIKIPRFQLLVFVACVIDAPSFAKDDSMGRMPLRAPRVLQLSRSRRTWKSLGVILLGLHVFVCFFIFASFQCLHLSSGVLLCYVSVENASQIRVVSSRWWSRFSFWCLAPFSAQHGRIASWIIRSTNRWENRAFDWIPYSLTWVQLYEFGDSLSSWALHPA